jgi:two-component system, NarL family, sensor histidine kinase DesK
MATRHEGVRPRWISSGAGLRGAPLTEDGIASSGITFHLWRLYQHAWLICLLFPLVDLVHAPITWGRVSLGLAALIFWAGGYSWLMWPHPASQAARARARSRGALLLWGLLTALVFVFSLGYGLTWLWLFIGLTACAGVLLPMRPAFVVVVLLTLAPLVLTVGTIGDLARIDWPWLIALLLLVRGLGLDMIGVARMGRAIRELHTARSELARLQVEEERLRLARDLHDLLGHTLAMITLKSELARQLITEDPARCAQELTEIEQVARQTLREVREAVAGYRHPRLESELAGAQQLLEAAGIAYQIEPLPTTLPPEIAAVLAWTVREGVTNVIRHSRARVCRIRLTHQPGRAGVEVINDGGRRADPPSAARRGLGLAGLRERVTALGGQMEVGPLNRGDQDTFRLWVELPLLSRRAGPRAGEDAP